MRGPYRRGRSLVTRDLTTSMQTERVTTTPVAMVNHGEADQAPILEGDNRKVDEG